jgi:hypothetical protein
MKLHGLVPNSYIHVSVSVLYIVFQYSYDRSAYSAAQENVWNTVKSSNFVILSAENIFFRQTLLRLPHDFLQY